jgi:hypothetical protein
MGLSAPCGLPAFTIMVRAREEPRKDGFSGWFKQPATLFSGAASYVRVRR